MITNPYLCSLCAVLFLMAGATPSRAAVTYWRADKGVDYLQVADNTQPTTPTNWYFYSDLGTDLIGDATNVVITGGNIAGSIAFDQNGSHWGLYVDYGTKAELDAIFPAGASYSIIVSSTLGTVIQSFNIAPDAYPPTPYLTGADYSSFQTFEVFEPMEVNWNELTGLAASVGFEIYEGSFFSDGDQVFDHYPDGTPMSTNLPLNLFVATSNYTGFLQFSNPTDVSGVGGFEVDGTLAFNSEVVFPISAVNVAVGYDDFDDNSMDTNKWIQILGDVDSDTFTETNNRLEYTSAGTGDTFVAWGSYNILSYTQDWSVAIDVTDSILPNAFGTGEESYFGILVAPEGDIANNISAEFLNSPYGREVATFASSNDVEVVSNTYAAVPAETVSLKISFDADTKQLYTAYSTGGDYVVQTNYAASSWGMTDSSYFLCAAFSGSVFFEVTNGQIYADNFRVYDTPAISNDIGLVELEFLHSYGDGSIFLEGNFIKVDAQTSHNVRDITFTTSGGFSSIVSNQWDAGIGLEWDVEIPLGFSTSWDPANDGDWIVTFGFIDGTVRSTIIPFTKEDGTTPMPNFFYEPMFLPPSPANNLVTSETSFSFAWAAAGPDAIYISVEEIVDGNEIGTNSFFFADSVPGENLGIVDLTKTDPLSTTNYGPIVFGEGLRRMRINEGYGRAAYSADGVPYVVDKQNESDIIFTITDDVDGDNMPDDWEIDFFGSTNAVDGGANDDFDEDGMLNFEEFIAGVNPTNGGSVFAVEDPGPSPAGFVINWNSVEGRKYGIYWAKTLSDGFDPVTPGYLPHPQNSYTDTVHTVEGCGFYYIDVQLDN